MADEEVVVSLTYDARSSAQTLGAQTAKTIQDLENVSKKANEVGTSVARINDSFSGLSRMVAKMATDFEPWTRSLKQAQAEAETLKNRITALQASSSRDVSQDALLQRSLSLIPQVNQRLVELTAGTNAAAVAQNRLNSQAYIDGFAKSISLINAASVSVEAHTNAINLFKLKIDTTITSLSSFANAQQLLSNSANRMTSEWTSATRLMTQLTEKFNPNIVAAQGLTSAMLELNTANKLGIITGEQYVAAQKQIADSFDPIIVKARAAAEAENLANKAALQRFQAMVGQAREAQNASTAQLGIMNVVNPAVGSELDRLGPNPNPPITAANSMIIKSVAQDRAEIENAKRDSDVLAISVKNAADRFDYLTGKFNQDVVAANNYRKTINELNEALNVGAVTLREYGLETSKAIDVYNKSTVAGQAAAKQNENLTDTHGKLKNAIFLSRVGALEFQAAVINSIQAASSGMNLTHVAIMEGAQVFGAVVQGTNQGFGIIKTAALAMISPIGLAVTALVGLAAGFAVVLTRAISNENQLRRFDTQLGGITQTSVTSSVGLQRLSFDLRNVGVAAADAEKGIISLGQNLNVNSGANSGAISNLSSLSLNVGARLGVGDAAGFAKVNEAINGQIAGVIKLGLETRAFTADEAKAFQADALHGQSIKAVNDALKLLDDRLSGTHKRSMDDLTQGVHSLSGEWNNLLNRLADLISWKKIEEEATTFVRGLSNLAEVIKSLTTGDFKINLSINWPGGMTTEQVIALLNNLVPGGITPSNDQAAKNRAYFSGRRDPNTGQMLGTPSDNGSTLSVVGITPAMGVGGAASSDLISKMIQIESRGNPNAVSSAGAGGLMQLMPGTAAGLGVSNVFDSSQNIAGGTKYINDLISKYGDVQTALMAYNWGPGNVDKYLAGQKSLPSQVSGYASAVLNATPNAASVEAVNKFLAGLGGGTSTASVSLANVPSFDLGGKPISPNIPSFSQEGMGSNLFAKPTQIADPKIVKESEDAIAKYNETLAKGDLTAGDAIKNAQLFNIEQSASIAGTNTYRAAIDAKMGVDEAKNLAAQEFNKTLEVGQIELRKNIDTQQIQIKGDNQVTDALKGGVEAMIQADARTKAIVENRQTGISVEEAYKKALAEGSAQAGKSAAEATVAMTPEIAAQEKLGVALNKGAAAAHEAEVANQAMAATQKVVDAANAEGAPITEGRIQKLLQENLAKTKQLDLDKQINSVRQSNIQSGNEIQVLQLQVGLQGKTSQEIERQTSLLQEKQKLDAEGLTSLNADYNKRLQVVDAVGRMKIALDDAQRAQQRLEDGLKQMAETIGSALTSAIAELFDKSKVTDWGAKIKETLTSIGSSLVQSQIIKPLTGSIFSALGFDKLAQDFGTFGGSSSSSSGSGLGGILGSLFGSKSSSSGGTNITVTKNSDGSINIKDIAGSGKGLFDAFSGNSSSSTSGLSSFLFGGVNSGFAAGTGAGEGIFTNLATGVTSDLVPSVATDAVSSGLLGSGGIGSALGGLGSVVPFIGPVLGIASLFLGGLFGNKKPPNLVSTGGINLSAGGTTVANPFSSGNAQNDQTAKQITDAISSFTKDILKQQPGSFISGNIDVQAGSRDGIKIGGTLGSVATGLVGEVKFSDAQSAIAATTLAIAQHLEGVSDTFKKVMAQVTDATQIQSAITFITTYDKLKVARDSFASGAETADAAFASIATDSKQVGQFAQAMAQINTMFQGLTDSANQFGLSLDPVKFGLDQATKRLQGDFRKALDSTFNSVTGNDFLNQIETAKKDLLNNQNEASAIMLNTDLEVQDKINTIYNTTISNLIANLQRDLTNLVVNLTSGPLSGVKIPAAIAAANENYLRELGLVQGGNLGESANLAAAGSNLLTLSQTGYGNGPQTAALRARVLGEINSVLGNSASTISNLITVPVDTSGVVNAVATSTGSSADSVAAVANDVAPAISDTVSAANDNTVVTVADAANVLQNAMELSGSGARGSLSTPKGKILVGELGPEWMLPGGARGDALNLGNWLQIGKSGPEVINQAGGGVILPFPYQPQDVTKRILEKRSFASGTLSGDDMIRAPSWMEEGGSAQMHYGNSMVNVVKELRAEIARLGNISQNGIMVNREGFSESVGHLKKIKDNTETSKMLQPVARRA